MSNMIKANTTKYEDFILPCPFCGETEEIYLEEYEHGAGNRWRIVCCSCMAQIDRGIDQHQALQIMEYKGGVKIANAKGKIIA